MQELISQEYIIASEEKTTDSSNNISHTVNQICSIINELPFKELHNLRISIEVAIHNHLNGKENGDRQSLENHFIKKIGASKTAENGSQLESLINFNREGTLNVPLLKALSKRIQELEIAKAKGISDEETRLRIEFEKTMSDFIKKNVGNYTLPLENILNPKKPIMEPDEVELISRSFHKDNTPILPQKHKRPVTKRNKSKFTEY